jgi:excinuclease ABC subunit A
MNVAYPEDGVPEPRWKNVTHSQHLACQKCGRSFEPLSPHNFSFNSGLGWCASCEGLGVQVGANPAALLRDSKLTLAQGAVDIWPNVAKPVSQWMLAALSRDTGVPLDVPFEQLNARHRRIIMHGTGEQWFDVFPVAWDSVPSTLDDSKDADAKRPTRPKKKVGTESQPTMLFRFQFKGLYPALEEASKLSPSLRARGSNNSSTRWNARRAAAAGCATTPPPHGSAIARSTTTAGCRSANWPVRSTTGNWRPARRRSPAR